MLLFCGRMIFTVIGNFISVVVVHRTMNAPTEKIPPAFASTFNPPNGATATIQSVNLTLFY